MSETRQVGLSFLRQCPHPIVFYHDQAVINARKAAEGQKRAEKSLNDMIEVSLQRRTHG